jgi:hypothetical protein
MVLRALAKKKRFPLGKRAFMRLGKPFRGGTASTARVFAGPSSNSLP